MRLDKRMVFHALCVIDETLRAADKSPIPPTPALRLALAVLHHHGAEREWIDQFWRTATAEGPGETGASAFGRRQTMNAAFNAMARQAGMERDHALEEAMKKARG